MELLANDWRSLRKLEQKAAELRLQMLETALSGRKGHIPPAYSWTEIAVALFYGGILQVRSSEPRWPGRDRLLLSKGHACLALYAALADQGFFPSSELSKFAGPGSLLPGHPDMEIPGVENASGSLGHGLGVGCGLALAARLDEAPWKVFVVLGDAECQEGSIWEAAMLAGHHRLHNLIAVVDRNRLGATDYTENYASLEPLADRFAAFGWETVVADGHDLPRLLDILQGARDRQSGKPFMLVAQTIKGRGVSFMQDSPLWHHRMPKGEEIETARAELKAEIARLQDA